MDVEKKNNLPDADSHRLHPLTMAHRMILGIPGFFLIIIPALRSGDTGSLVTLYIAMAVGLLGLPIIVLQYRRFRYWITPKEIIIHSGVFTRKHRNIPIERIQNVEIIQRLLPRMFGTAKVNVVTAGSTTTEGVLEFVSLKEAHRIRQVVRSYQGIQKPIDSTGTEQTIEVEGNVESKSGSSILYRMSAGRVILSGVFRFSLFYIAIIFSTLQLFEPDPEGVIDWIEGGSLEPFVSAILESPFFAATLLVIVAALISWISGILVNINRFFNFQLDMDDGRIHKRSGLLTISEGTIPLAKIQALIRRTNPVMRRYGWWSLGVQTMGHDVNEQRHKLAVPFGTAEETVSIAHKLFPIDLPSRYLNVSRYTIRRMIVRLTVALTIVVSPTAYFWRPALWALCLLPLIVWYAILRYRNLGYSFDGKVLGIRKGVIKHVEWSTSIDKSHVFYLRQSIFQRRYGIKTLYVDTAGASPVSSPSIVDMPADAADELMETLYGSFQGYFGDSTESESRLIELSPR
ncbi:MAG: PH domain-containing protein [Rhodothermales bacterium]|nr:PH domain-containing protein [Rhodothermales bacterium]